MDTKLLSTDRPIAIYYSFVTDVESIVRSGASSMVVTFKDEKDWKAINTTIGTINLQEDPVPTDAGEAFVTKLNSNCPGHDDGTPEDIALLSGRPVLIRIDYKSGLKKLIGNMDSAPKLIIKIQSDQTTSRKLQSDWKSPEPNYWLQ